MEENNNNLNQNEVNKVNSIEASNEKENYIVVEEQAIDNELKKENKKFIIVILILLLILLACVVYLVLKPKEENNLEYQISDNSISDFDLQFLKIENEKKNKIYSPLSIKYALLMLEEGANGKTKAQITNLIGNYNPKKYLNNANMSFANAMFIKNNYKNFIRATYIDALTKKYNAEIVYDSFENPDKLNSWVSEKTFKLINNLVDDISSKDFILINALAIDMEWINMLQTDEIGCSLCVSYWHENYSKYIGGLGDSGEYSSLKFNELKDNVAAVEIGAVVNKFDIVKTFGEENIRKTVGDEYQKWLDNGAPESCYDSESGEKDPDRETFLKDYLEELNGNYKSLNTSTDFLFYVNNNVKVFAKDLKEYAGTTLEYIGIMPTNTELNTFIENNNAKDINNLISNLKPLTLDSFQEGYITEISAYIPMFKFDYQLNLKEDLNKLGVKNIFDEKKADLSNLTTEKNFISDVLHKSNIEFSNYGIKASAVTLAGGGGGGECGYDYIFDIPASRIKKIDLTFDKPYMFLIIDKKTKEVWFTGTVYEPSDYEEYQKNLVFNEDYE